MQTTTSELAPQTRYRRQIKGASFSLEANTEAVPDDGHFYLLKDGEVELRSDSFTEAVDAYNRMCRNYWAEHLESDDHEERMASAWGLIALDSSNAAAIEVIRQDGTDKDVQRMEQLRKKARFGRKSPSAFGRRKKE